MAWGARLAGGLLTILAVTARADGPKGVMDPKAPAKRPAVLSCYDDMDDACRKAKDKLKDCQPPVEVTELPVNTKPADYAARMKALPPGTPLFLVGHGFGAPKRKGGETLAEVEKLPDTFHLGTGGYDTFEDDRSRLRVPRGVAGEDILTALKGTRPTVWVSACHAGMMCGNSGGFCLGGSCQKDEVTTTSSSDGFLDRATAAILELYCSETEFKGADSDKNGTLDKTELTSYFCDKARGGRPYIEFWPRNDDPKNKDKIKELVGLLVDEHNGDLDEKGRERLRELETENDAGDDTKFAYEMTFGSYRNFVRFYLRKFKDRVAKGKLTWREDDKRHRFSRSGKALDSLLVVEFPAPERKACLWIDGSTVRTFHPHLDHFALKFNPTPDAGSGTGSGASGTTGESHGDRKKEEKQEKQEKQE